MRGERLLFFDNLKGFLILLVVLGHYLPSIPRWNVLATCVHELVFLFHMPLFVFISGFFAKGVLREGRLRVEKVFSFAALAFAYQVALIAIEPSRTPFFDRLFTFSSASWYLMALVWWYLLIPVLSQTRPVPALAGSTALALVAGCVEMPADFLAVSRTVVFAPFFLLGYYCPLERVMQVRESPRFRWVVPAAVAFAALWFASGLAGRNPFFAFKAVLHADTPYAGAQLAGMAQRLASFAGAALVSLGVMRAAPDRRTPLSTMGERSLQVYVLHRLARTAVRATGVFALPVFFHPAGAVLGAAAVSTAVAALCSLKLVTPPFNAVARLKWRWLRSAEAVREG